MPPELSQNTDEGGESRHEDDYEILTTSQVSSKIIEIIEKAEEYCFIVTPYFSPWVQSEKSLEYASNKKKKIIFFFRDDQREEKKVAIEEFHNTYHFDIVFIENLHAKIYVNEKEALITSMNLYDYSQRNNYEIGVLIRNKVKLNEIVYNVIIDKIFKTGKTSSLGNKYLKLLEKDLFLENEIRYCVLCGEPRRYTPDFKFCLDCRAKDTSERNLITNWLYCYGCGEKYNRDNKSERIEKKLFCLKCQQKNIRK